MRPVPISREFRGHSTAPRARRASAAPRLIIAILLLPLLIAGCANSRIPRNAERALFSPEKATDADAYAGQKGGLSRNEPDGVCAAPGVSNFILPGPPRGKTKSPAADKAMRYSPGDRFNITVPGMEDFTGDYAVNADGRVILPFAGEIHAVGLTNADLQKRIEGAFIKAGVFKADGLKISVRPMQFAPINIYVQGAVFDPGRAVINNLKDSDKTEKFMTKFGDSPLDRFVPSALHSAGGVRPDADVSHIKLIRNGQEYVLDWRGAFTGDAVDDVALIEGDKLFVPEAPCFQSGLVRPSQITTPGIHIHLSNLTQPALNNAGSAITKDSVGLPYGTRLLQALVTANCVGGSQTSNAGRHAVLISKNPKTLRTEVIQRSIEELVRSPDRDALNPHLMPEDAVACYDSAATEAREVLSTFSSMFGGASQAKNLRGW
jgi:polysaccharide export outer membrane protein